MKRKFITDMGAPLVSTDSATGESLNIGRYGVWDYIGHHSGKSEVIACGDDLAALQAEYGPNLSIYVFTPEGLVPAPA